MKRILQLLSLFTVILMGISCGQVQKSKLKMAVESTDNECPIDMGICGSCTGVTYDDDVNRVEFEYHINEGLMDINTLKSSPTMRKSLKLLWQDEDFKEFLRMVINADAGLRVTMKSAGKKAELDFSPEDLQEVVDSELSEKTKSVQYLELQADMLNAQCPMTVDELTTMKYVEIKNNTFSYVYNIDESMASMQDLKLQQAQLRTNIRQTFSDVAIAMFVQQLAIAEYNLEYRYVGSSSGEELSIIFSTDEL